MRRHRDRNASMLVFCRPACTPKTVTAPTVDTVGPMPRATANGIEIEYDTFGTPADPSLLLVMGLGGQMTAWEDGFCELLASHGRYVIRFDNRDVGLSTKLDDTDVDVAAVVMAALAGEPVPPVPYTLSAMSDDAVGLLDALGIERAHIVGASMGGMIVQTMAIEHPERVLTLTSVMVLFALTKLPTAVVSCVPPA